MQAAVCVTLFGAGWGCYLSFWWGDAVCAIANTGGAAHAAGRANPVSVQGHRNVVVDADERYFEGDVWGGAFLCLSQVKYVAHS